MKEGFIILKAKNKIIDIANYNNGYVTTKQVKEAKINTMELTRLVNNKVFERVSRGFYALTNINSDDFYKYQLKSKNAIYSHNTALYFHNLSDRNPITLDISVPVGYHGSLSTLY